MFPLQRYLAAKEQFLSVSIWLAARKRLDTILYLLFFAFFVLSCDHLLYAQTFALILISCAKIVSCSVLLLLDQSL